MLDPVTKGFIALRPAAAARTLARLDIRDSTAMFEAMPRQLAVEVLEHMTPGSASRCLAQMPARTSGEILARTRIQNAAAVLRSMKREQAKSLLAALPRPAAARLRLRLRYPETLIGAFVDAEVVTFGRDLRVGDALRLLRRAGQRTEHVIYVLDERRHLVGAVDLGDLLGQRDRSMLQRVVRPASVVLNARAAIQTVSSHPAWLTYDSLPVTTRDGVFQGVLRRSQVTDEEQQLLADVADRNELTTTRAALADIFWIGVGALFVGNDAQAARDRAED